MGLPDRDLVIFDLDGTLVDSLPATFRCFAAAMAPVLGREPGREEMRARFGPADHTIVRAWAAEAGCSPAAGDAAVGRLYAGYAREFARLRPVAGTVDLLRALRASGRRTALFTGRGRPSTDRLLATAGLESLFDLTVTGEEPRRPKPEPDGLLLIAERLGMDPARAVYVGDSRFDAEAAERAGMAAVVVRWARGSESEPVVDGVIEAKSVEELAGLLGIGPGAGWP
jgi:phosphoglycolate phosphatase/pyrophosphatase PpaX